MREVGHFPKHQQVVAPEALRTLPLIALFVEAREGDVVPRLILGAFFQTVALTRPIRISSTGFWFAIMFFS